MKRKVVISITVLLAFLFARYMKYFWAYAIFGKNKWNSLDEFVSTNILVYSQIFIVLVVSYILFKKDLFKHLGIHQGFIKGITIGGLCVLPMLIGFLIMSNFNVSVDLKLIYKDFVIAGFFEEFLFRGFLFGILFYVAGWGFIPAVIVPSIYFGLGHLYQAESLNDAIGVFLFTGLGSAGFAWFYTAWRNLWVLIFLHGFMDFAWDMVQIDTNVTGNLTINIFRFTTLGLLIFLSIRNVNKIPGNGIRNKLWVNRESSRVYN